MVVLCHECVNCAPNSPVAQVNTSFNYTRGTWRGLQRQLPPYAEDKLVRCMRGAIVDAEVRQQDGVICQVSGRCKPARVIYRVAGTKPVRVVGAEPRR
jgi:hypothetical protein